MERPTPPGGRSAPPAYADEPPAYGYSEPSVVDDNSEMGRSGSGRGQSNNAASMRLLPDDGDGENMDAYSSRADVGSRNRTDGHQATPRRREYVHPGADTPSFPSKSSIQFSPSTKDPPKSEASKEIGPGKSGDSPSVQKPTSSASQELAQETSDFRTRATVRKNATKPKDETSTTSPSGKNGHFVCHSDISASLNVKPPPYSQPNGDSLPVPAPLRIASPKAPVQLKPGSDLDEISASPLFRSDTRSLDSNGLSPIHESTEEERYADKIIRSPAAATRPSPQRYHPLHQHNSSAASLPTSRPQSSLGNAPNIPPPGSQADSNQFSARSGSPTRPLTPSRGQAASSGDYEPADINGSPRPGTPSSRYGGSPRRPLPPAPLFSGPAPVSAGAGEHSIDIADGDGNKSGRGDEDVFGGNGRTMHPNRGSGASVTSYGSYLSDETAVTDERDAMSKVPLDDDDDEDDEELDSKVHYGPAPKGRQSRRGVREAQMTKKEVKLINGELVLECKIPTILHSFLPRRDDREFTHMRYTAVTCDPDDFTVKGYKLRQNIGSTMRETELLVCVTMYNENELHFTRTMHGIMRNISHFCSRTKSRTWGKDGWQKIVVCIIADGRRTVHQRTLNALAAMGLYQDGIAKNVVNQKEVTAHVYEYTTQVSLDSDLKFKGAEKGIVPCQMILCLKERNQKKLNSHRWLFNAIGRALTPNVCILLDVGTKPAPTALYHLWKAFDQDSNVAGAAGEIKAGKGKGFLGLLNPLVASQNFEYKMSNILDKPLESVFGYITVLPGALSAYRYHALQNDSTGHGPLSQYFKGEMLHGKDADVFTANMYLAEDRILCWELVAKREERWLLKFVKSAVGETDVPGELPQS